MNEHNTVLRAMLLFLTLFHSFLRVRFCATSLCLGFTLYCFTLSQQKGEMCMGLMKMRYKHNHSVACDADSDNDDVYKCHINYTRVPSFVVLSRLRTTWRTARTTGKLIITKPAKRERAPSSFALRLAVARPLMSAL